MFVLIRSIGCIDSHLPLPVFVNLYIFLFILLCHILTFLSHVFTRKWVSSRQVFEMQDKIRMEWQNQMGSQSLGQTRG